MKTASAELSLDFLTVSALSGAERAQDASAQLERAARCCRAPGSDTRARCDSVTVTVMVLVSSASGPRVSGCIRDPRNFPVIRTPNVHNMLSAPLKYCDRHETFLLQGNQEL